MIMQTKMGGAFQMSTKITNDKKTGKRMNDRRKTEAINKSDFSISLTNQEEGSAQYSGRIHMHPSIRPALCVGILAMSIIITAVGLCLGTDGRLNTYFDISSSTSSSSSSTSQTSSNNNNNNSTSTPTTITDQINNSKLILRSHLINLMIAFFVIGGTLLILSIIYIIVSVNNVKTLINITKAKSSIIHKHMSIRAQNMYEREFKDRYGYRGYFEDVVPACQPVHRMEIKHDVDSDDEAEMFEKSIMDNSELERSLHKVSQILKKSPSVDWNIEPDEYAAGQSQKNLHVNSKNKWGQAAKTVGNALTLGGILRNKKQNNSVMDVNNLIADAKTPSPVKKNSW